MRTVRPWRDTGTPVTTSSSNAACEPAADEERDPHTELATVVEAMALAQEPERTLTDPATAQAYQIGIDAAQLVVDAAYAQGAVSEYGHRKITNMLVNMRTVPHQL